MNLSKLFTAIFISFSFVSFSQDFVGKDAYLFKGATVKPVEASSEGLKEYMYKNFYLHFDTVTKLLTKDYIGKKKLPFKPFQTGEYASTSVSQYDKLLGQEYKVIGVYNEANEYDKDKFVLALNNAAGTIYYEYDPRYKHDLELAVIGGLNFPAGYFCTKLTTTVDKFTKKTSIYSPEEGGVTFIKNIEGTDTTVYLSVSNYGTTVVVDGKGLIVLFEDGTKFEKPNVGIDVKVADKGGFNYRAFLKITKEELALFASKKVTDTRLYIYDRTLQPDATKLILQYAKCMTN